MADLRLDQSAPVQVRPGDRIVYTLTVTNLGPDTATGVHLENPIPEGLQPVAAALPPGCSIGNGKISCDLPDLAPQQARTVQLTFDALQTCLPSIVNRATVSANEDDSPEDSEVSTFLNRASSLEVEKTGPATARPGGSIPYTLKVTNLGPDLACGVVLDDPLPAGLSSPVIPAGCALTAANEIHCPIGELPAGQTRTFPVSFTVLPTAACGSQIVNTVVYTDVSGFIKMTRAMTPVVCDIPALSLPGLLALALLLAVLALYRLSRPPAP